MQIEYIYVVIIKAKSRVHVNTHTQLVTKCAILFIWLPCRITNTVRLKSSKSNIEKISYFRIIELLSRLLLSRSATQKKRESLPSAKKSYWQKLEALSK